jgi:hypothetical protein
MHRILSLRSLLTALATTVALASLASAAPTTVTIPGSFQSEVGCPGDWDPACAATHLVYDANDDVWQAVFNVPAGNYEYKAALDDSWTVNYGANAQQNGANIPLNLAATTSVKFYYDDKTHWVTSRVNSVIVTVPGSFQSEMGCAGDWDPSCLRSWLQDTNGDGTYTFMTSAIPPGSYECKVAIDEGWAENYGAGGVPNGPNIAFTVAASPAFVTFTYVAATHVLTVDVEGNPPPSVTSVTIPGSLQSELGCAGDWDPACAATHLAYDAEDDVWQRTFTVPAGNWEYKAALNDSWAENYGANAQQNGPNIGLNLGASTGVKFYYDHKSHWVCDDANTAIAVAVGNFQSEAGCNGDWDPSCLRTWMQDTDGDGTFTFSTTAIPPGNYEAKVAHDEGWAENYGAGGVPGGANIPFSVGLAGSNVTFSYVLSTHVLTITVDGPVPVRQATWGQVKVRYR